MSPDNSEKRALPEEREAEIRARLAAATPGKWFLVDADQDEPLIVSDLVGDGDLRGAATVLGCSPGDYDAEPRWIVEEADARLIANAPADLSWALSRIEAQAIEIDELKADRIRHLDDVLRELREPLTLADVRALRSRLTLECNDRIRAALSPAASPISAVESPSPASSDQREPNSNDH